MTGCASAMPAGRSRLIKAMLLSSRSPTGRTRTAVSHGRQGPRRSTAAGLHRQHNAIFKELRDRCVSMSQPGAAASIARNLMVAF